MREIILKHGSVALVDDEDYEHVSTMKWREHKSAGNIYAVSTIPKTTSAVMMHRIIMGAVGDECVDHKNFNGLDNQKENLRLCTKAENQRYQRPTKGRKYKGTTLAKSGKYIAQITVNYKHKYLGVFVTEEEAARAYNEAAKVHFGEFAWLNSV